MKKLFRRFIAYFIDMLVIILITQSLSGIPQINKQLDDYNKYYDDYLSLYENYASFKLDLKDVFVDKKLDEEEYNSLVEDHDNYVGVLNNYYKEGILTEDNYKKLNDKVDKDYSKEYNNIYYKIEKNSLFYFVIYLLAVILYFVFFNLYTGGQTLGKKLMRLKIVNSRNMDDKVPVWSFVVRLLLLYQPVYYLVKLIGINFMDVNMYNNVTSIIYNIQAYLEMLIIIMVMMRFDGRGPHDFLARTRVVLYDRNGDEIQDKPDIIVKKINDLKGNDKVIDEERFSEENMSLENTKDKRNRTNKKVKTKKVIDDKSTE